MILIVRKQFASPLGAALGQRMDGKYGCPWAQNVVPIPLEVLGMMYMIDGV